MKSDNGIGKDAVSPSEKITIDTGVSKYSFTQSWIDNPALKDILVGLVADDYSSLHNNDKYQ